MLDRIGPTEILLIVVVALLIFGPAKLPQLGKSVGESIREFKRSMREVTDDTADKAAAAKEAEK